MEYVGERISHREADRRYAAEHEHSPHTMLFAVDDKTVIDATQWGNSSRFINHSCAPNCEADEIGGRIFITSIRDIPAGAELTYDYNMEPPSPLPRDWRTRYACRCGTMRCRGTIVVPPRRRKTTRRATR